MFVLEPSLVQLAASPDDVLTLLTSLNKPMVALEDHPMDEGEATIWSVRRESDMLSTYVHLCLTNKKIGVFYRYEVDPYPDDLRGMVEAEALGFTESLGFIMDNTHYAELDAEERKQYLERSPFEWAGIEIGEETHAPADDSTVEADDFGEADQEVIAARGSDEGEALLSDEEVDGAVRALTGGGPAALEAPGAGPSDDAFDRAVEEFIAVGEGAPEVAMEAATETADSPFARSPLSRFQRRKADSDIYQIRGLEPAPGVREAAADVDPPPPGPPDEPETALEAAAESGADFDAAGEADAPPAEAEAPAADVVPGDPETRARRARARFLASF